jgi:hypothetical protein
MAHDHRRRLARLEAAALSRRVEDLTNAELYAILGRAAPPVREWTTEEQLCEWTTEELLAFVGAARAAGAAPGEAPQ